MDKRFILFLFIAFTAILVNQWVLQLVNPPPPRPVAAQKDPVAEKADKAAKQEAPAEKANGADAVAGQADPKADAVAAEAPPKEADAGQPAVAPQAPEQLLTLGSLDPSTPYRMLVTLTTGGAAVRRIELNSPRFSDLDDRGGYLGELDLVADPVGGCRVRTVGPGTPAESLGLQAGDVILDVDGVSVIDPATWAKYLNRLKPGDEVGVRYLRNGQNFLASIPVSRKPLEVIRPEGEDQLSFLLTMDSVDGQTVPPDAQELAGLQMRSGNWELVPGNDADSATFRWLLPDHGLEVLKTYRLALTPAGEEDNRSYPSYHLDFTVEVRNTGDRERSVAYRLDGPTGLTTEAWWYATKIGRDWGGAGVRDATVAFRFPTHTEPVMLGNVAIIDDEPNTVWEQPATYAGVDAQYVNVALIPAKTEGLADWPARLQAIRVGPVPAESGRKKLTNVSVRTASQIAKLPPGETLTHSFQIFAGPKRTGLLAHYGLESVVYYGWPIFAAVSRPMVWILHVFYSVVGNYGIAIIMLTVLVRICMFPLSRKQAMSARKMQELQPEMKKIAEKYKNDMQARGKAQQALFKQHKFSPMAGCLPALVQLPIFLGLYRGLSLDVELRQAPLISDAFRWCSNLAAPDMLFRWDHIVWKFLSDETGWLGPYFNVLPCITIALFLAQQKLFMPPPTDEQSAMQQKIMKYMMVFMGLMFFKVPSGLCIYFIASSLWGIAERKLLPKSLPAAGTPAPPPPGGGGRTAAVNGSSPAPRKPAPRWWSTPPEPVRSKKGPRR